MSPHPSSAAPTPRRPGSCGSRPRVPPQPRRWRARCSRRSAQGVRDFGEDPVAAHVVKLAGNFLIAAASEAMAEAYTLGEKCGLDRVQLAEFFGASLFPSRIYQNYGKAIAEHRYEPAGFKLKLGLKDLRLVLGAADACEMPMPFAGAILHDRFPGARRRRATARWTGPRSVWLWPKRRVLARPRQKEDAMTQTSATQQGSGRTRPLFVRFM